MKLAPSVLAGDLADLAGELAELESVGCDLVHFDIKPENVMINASHCHGVVCPDVV